MSVEDALSVMANHVEELGNGGNVMHVPPGEDISERLPSVTGGNDACSEEAGESESNSAQDRQLVMASDVFLHRLHHSCRQKATTFDSGH